MRRAERKRDRVLRRRGLQLEVEATAKALTKCQAPGPIDPAPERRVHHELHAAALIEEALQNNRIVGGNHAQRPFGRRQVVHQLTGGRAGYHRVALGSRSAGRTVTSLVHQPLDRGIRVVEPLIDLCPQLRDRSRELPAAPRCLTHPEGDSRRLPSGIFHTHAPGLDSEDAPGSVP